MQDNTTPDRPRCLSSGFLFPCYSRRHARKCTRNCAGSGRVYFAECVGVPVCWGPVPAIESMEVDYNPIDLPINSDFKEDSEFKDLDGVDVKDMRLEAEAVVNDVLFAVGNMFVSKNLPCAVDVAYINVEIREGTRYCLELTEAGLRVVGHAFDNVNEDSQTQYHETIYSLLDSLSPAYREAFGNALLQRLEALKRDGQS
ncbi:GSK3B-interacting protein isoform X2 [Ambystoma mexicanum]|uniref:GSK3B-interacting protein isoform X2 n=2 Tax=Ambystoma mexicanum TaxID=8296 RepID=UPI0037E85889